jgi:hypothetical protein
MKIRVSALSRTGDKILFCLGFFAAAHQGPPFFAGFCGLPALFPFIEKTICPFAKVKFV